MMTETVYGEPPLQLMHSRVLAVYVSEATYNGKGLNTTRDGENPCNSRKGLGLVLSRDRRLEGY